MDFEEKKWEDEVRLRTRELEIKDAEAHATIQAQAQSRWTSPLVVAIFAAALAGIGNAAVAWITGSNQLQLETSKHNEEKAIEEAKAESSRILEVVKTVDPDKAAENLAFLIEAGLISNKEMRTALTAYLKRRKGGEGISIASGNPSIAPGNVVTTTTGPELDQSKPNPAGAGAGTQTVQYQTGWIPGGHNQASSCAEGQAKLQPAYPGKMLILLSSNETSRKDFVGHVEYNYFCEFRVAAE